MAPLDFNRYSGLDLLHMMLAGEVPPPPIAATMNIALTAAERGAATFEGSPTDGHLNPMGATHGGWAGSILDSAMGCAVQTMLAPGQVYTTLEYKVNITRAIPVGTEVICRAEVQHAGRTTAIARGEIRGKDDDRLYGTGSTTCVILKA